MQVFAEATDRSRLLTMHTVPAMIALWLLRLFAFFVHVGTLRTAANRDRT